MKRLEEHEHVIVMTSVEENYQIWYKKETGHLCCGEVGAICGRYEPTVLGVIVRYEDVLPVMRDLERTWSAQGYEGNYHMEEAFFMLVNNYLVDHISQSFHKEEFIIEMLDSWQCYGSFMEDGDGLLDLDPVVDRDEIVTWISWYMHHAGKDITPTRGLTQMMIDWARAYCR